MTIPRIALFYDWLNCWGGAERLLLNILQVFPQSQLFTTIHDPKKTKWLPKNTKVHASLLSKITKTNNIITGLAQALAIEQLDFTNFDIVISLTSLNGKALLTPPSTFHICYCLTPNRHLYQKKHSFIPKPIVRLFKQIDLLYSHRPDSYLTISKTVQKRINRRYRQTSTIVYPGIDTNIFKLAKNQNPNKNYYLIVSRLVPYKKVDLVIKVFKKINKKIYIVGTGRQQNFLKKSASTNQNIKFLGKVSDKKLINLYQNSRALICPQIEDFGLTPIEAQACGCPVIAFNQGGISETVINKKTAILFDKQTPKSLKKAIHFFESIDINSQDCRQQSIKFCQQFFVLNFKKEVLNQWRQYQNKQTNIS